MNELGVSENCSGDHMTSMSFSERSRCWTCSSVKTSVGNSVNLLRASESIVSDVSCDIYCCST